MEIRNGDFNLAADVIYGLICVSFSFVGVLGNIFSFFFFKAKKRDISTVIYMLITGCDIVISIFVFPVGISLFSQRNPGPIFGNKISCTAWVYAWHSAILLSYFLVICLSITRTFSLLRPFERLKIKKIFLSVTLFTVLALVHSLWYYIKGGYKVAFSPGNSKCVMIPFLKESHVILIYFVVFGRGIFYVAPMFVVAISCVMSAVLLSRKNENVQQRELQQSRNRATITILLFALLYGTCNILHVIHVIMQMVYVFGRMSASIFEIFYKFDVYGYYFTAIGTLLIAANSAVNPILYLWRMPRLRDYVLAEPRKYLKVVIGLFRLNRVTMETRPDAVVVDETCN